MRRPAFLFYPADWRKDPALSSCSLAARGLWIELMCIAHESEEYGFLAINNKPMTTQQIARMVGESPAVVAKLLAELADAGVFSQDERGVIYSRRMVKDERIRNIRAKAGRLGGNPNLVKQKDNQKDNHLDNQMDNQNAKQNANQDSNQNAKQNPTPSFSFSFSSSSSSSSLPSCLHTLESTHLPEESSEAIASDGKPSKMAADEIIFGYGVPLLTSAGVAEKHARSFLGGLRKQHGDSLVIDKLRECMRAKPLQPLEWLAAALPPGGVRRAGKQSQIESRNAAVVSEWVPPELREVA